MSYILRLLHDILHRHDILHLFECLVPDVMKSIAPEIYTNIKAQVERLDKELQDVLDNEELKLNKESDIESRKY
jgi:hypothetical protein